jgi:hypothetical protein
LRARSGILPIAAAPWSRAAPCHERVIDGATSDAEAA